MKNILYCNFLRSLDPKVTENVDLEDREPRLFAKYFPKYIKKISFSVKDASVKSKVKRTKIIQEVSPQECSQREFFVFLNWKMLDWKILLGNKIKSLKTFSDSSGASQKLHQELRLFSGLKSFSICFPLGSGADGKYWKKTVRMMNYLTNLKSLSIRNLTDGYDGFLEKLNSSKRLLSSLTELKIVLKAKGKRDDEWFHNYQISELLLSLRIQKNILKHVTHLNLRSLADSFHFASFKDFAGSCPKLETLSFEFSNANERKEETVDMDYLGTLKTFQSLKSLELGIGDIVTCLKYLVLPSSIQHLVLNFKERLTKGIIYDMLGEFSQSKKVLEENPIFIRFFDLFENLQLLESFDISFREDSDVDIERFQSSFQNCLLKRVPTLKNFTSRLSAPDSSGFIRRKKFSPAFETSDSSLPQFFGSFHHSCKTLKTLEIGNEKIRYTNFDLSASRGKFPELSTIKLTGKFDSSNLERLGELENFVLLGDSLTKIQLFIHMNHYVKSFVYLLEYLSQVKMPEKLHIEVEVWFFDKKDLEDLSEVEFDNLINQGTKSILKASLKVNTNIGSKGMRKFLEVFGERFEKFEVQERLDSKPVEKFCMRESFEF